MSTRNGGILASACSFLFVPADRPDRYAKAIATGADAIIIDLEDAVGVDVKEQALSTMVRWLSQQRTDDRADQEQAGQESQPQIVVRINALRSRWHAAEVAALSGSDVAVMVPKAEDPAALEALSGRLPGTAILALVETPIGVLEARALASASGVVRLALGNVDLAASIGVPPTSRHALAFARSSLVHASAAAGIAAPVDGVTTTLRDPDAVIDDLRHGLEMGMGAKLCIHPGQVAPVNAAFLPSAREMAWAEQVLAVPDDGVATLHGEMIDRPVRLRAEAIRARGRRQGQIG
ncbi:CoA ester lyase [Nocardioides sp. AE5]|uniref:HpcH/HpaI aldolase/citrate lyase family protein n=1 Tax=Nocardioides sp. AE5 TaxID=2962573 RepID=UPI002882C1C4|nr:CoA ester lyase [Nocardioides sp. AE5]MDT0203168.1 CoA ester lyase [Nocardioides sp. AE5]